MNEKQVIDVAVSNIFAEGGRTDERQSPGALLSSEWSDITALGGVEVDDIGLVFGFPRGLAAISRDGRLLQASAEVEVQVRSVDGEGRDIGEWRQLLTKHWVMASLGAYEERITFAQTGLHRIRARSSIAGGSSVICDITVKKTRRQQAAMRRAGA